MEDGFQQHRRKITVAVNHTPQDNLPSQGS